MKETRTGGACQPVGGLMTAGLMLALFIAALDSTVVATALPKNRPPWVERRIMPGL